MTDRDSALTHLYHPSGAKVDIPLSLLEDLTVDAARRLVLSVDALLEVGFTVNLPGIGDGETLDQIGFVVRKSKINDDGTETPVIDLYLVNGSFRWIGHYLNTPQMIADFEAACGIKLDKLPLYEGDNSIERGKNPKLDKYVVPLPRPAKLVWKNNPKWEGENDKKHPKRVFVRWHELRPGSEESEMSLAQALEYKTPSNKRYAELDATQLQYIVDGDPNKIKPESKQAARLVLQHKFPQTEAGE